MQASDRVFILAQFEPESAGNNFLKHRKGEHVMRQPEERVVGSHACKHTEPPPSHHELERTGAWDFLVVFFDVCSVEELDNCPAGVEATKKEASSLRSTKPRSWISNSQQHSGQLCCRTATWLDAVLSLQ